MKKNIHIKLWKSLRILVAIVATFLLAWTQISPSALAAINKPAEQFTIDFNDSFLDSQGLDIDDTTDFDFATRGFIDKLDPPTIKLDPQYYPDGTEIRDVWDLVQYNFLLDGAGVPSYPGNLGDLPTAEDLLYTVNPSLLRNAQLNMQHGLYEVVPGIYQLRGYDLSVMTLVEGDTGWIVIDPLTSNEPAKAALDLANGNINNLSGTMNLPKHPGRTNPLPVSAVIYTHSHVDHFAGIKGIVDPADGIPIYAPEGFLEEAVSENVFAGNVMSRRASYMYGNLIGKGEKGQVDGGLGKTTSTGYVSLIAPTVIVDEELAQNTQDLFADATPNNEYKIDGVKVVFQNVPGSEAPAEMLFYFPEFYALCASEDATHTMHNLYTLRGAKVRDSLGWANYLSDTIELFGDDIQVVFASHHWPTWNNPDTTDVNEVVEYLKKQRDLYKYIHDQTLHMANQGYTMLEIAEMLELPDSLSSEWYNRGYYGSLNHNVKAVYQYYLGWFDGNPAHLYSLPPEQAGYRYIEYMGGPRAAIEQAQADFDKDDVDVDDYRWVAQVMSDVVFGYCKENLPPYPSPYLKIKLDPDTQNCFDATQLEADALEQLGYQAESGPWRNFFLGGAKELRDGVVVAATPATGSPDILNSMGSDLLFDYMAILLDGKAVADDGFEKVFKMSFPDLSEGEQDYLLYVENGVLVYSLIDTPNEEAATLDATVTINRSDLNNVILGVAKIRDVADIDGNKLAFYRFLGYLDSFEFWFNVVLP